ncbi:helix-turn-helix transcriptional regulator, partial [Citrobacter freundii]|uniref:helix-turn-helix transcriptional regulator n=1 Tax=Citrobacter freundii TaxID=546 RepID=UPI0029345CD6
SAPVAGYSACLTSFTSSIRFSLHAYVFPELSKKQLEIVTLYAHGNTYESIADICNISVETVRSHLKRSTKALNLKSNDAMRAVILSRSYFFMISLMITN